MTKVIDKKLSKEKDFKDLDDVCDECKEIDESVVISPKNTEKRP